MFILGVIRKTIFSSKRILLLCHENADLDSFCSAAIFQDYLQQTKISAVIGVPSHINEQTLSFALKHNISFSVNPDLLKYDLVCLFDFNDYEQLGKLQKSFSALLKKNAFSVIAFDHHEIEKRSIDLSKKFVDPNAFSTTQLLFNLIGKKLSKRMAFFACIGMLEDTGRFLVGSKELFNAFSFCLSKSGKNYSDIFEESKHVVRHDEQMAFIKAAQRAQIFSIGKIIVVVSELSFYQGPAATILIDFGAHISLVAGTEKNGSSVLSARAETYFKEKSNFNLMTHLMKPLQEAIGGEVGGHSGAAQWSGTTNHKKVVKEAINILNKKFS